MFNVGSRICLLSRVGMFVGISTMVLFRERIYVQRRMKRMLIFTCRYTCGDINNDTL